MYMYTIKWILHNVLVIVDVWSLCAVHELLPLKLTERSRVSVVFTALRDVMKPYKVAWLATCRSCSDDAVR